MVKTGRIIPENFRRSVTDKQRSVIPQFLHQTFPLTAGLKRKLKVLRRFAVGNVHRLLQCFNNNNRAVSGKTLPRRSVSGEIPELNLELGGNRVRERREPWNEPVLRDGDLARLVSTCRPRDTCDPDIHQAHAAARLLFVKGADAFAAGAVGLREIDTHCRDDDAVAQFEGPDTTG